MLNGLLTLLALLVFVSTYVFTFYAVITTLANLIGG